MTIMPYSYSEAALTNSQPLRAAAIPTTPTAQANTPSPERLAAINNLSVAFGALPQQEQESHLATINALNLRGEAAVSYIGNIMSGPTKQSPEPVITTPVAAVATIETAAVDNPNLQNFLTGHIAQFDFAKDEEWKRQSYRTPTGPVPGLTTFAAVSAVTASPIDPLSNGAALDFAFDQGPTRGLPNLKGGPARGGLDFA